LTRALVVPQDSRARPTGQDFETSDNHGARTEPAIRTDIANYALFRRAVVTRVSFFRSSR
jgi:hypothetical protein